jgi:hypothetical protein
MLKRKQVAIGVLASWTALWLTATRASAQQAAPQPPTRQPAPELDLPGEIPPVPADRMNGTSAADCPPPDSAQSQFRALSEIPVGMQLEGKVLPPDCSQNVFYGTQVSAPLRDTLVNFQWAPANFFHRPLYFEDVPLERYGQSVCPHWQPVISGGRFFLTLPILPYKIGADHPHECVTILGYRRPGICAPCVMQVPPPLEWDAALLQAGTAVGLVFLLP